MNKNASDLSPVSGPDAVRTFYDHFFSAGGKDYASHTNLRIEKAIARILPLVRPDSVVLELGCGTGLVAEQIANVARSGSVWACDISDHAIAVAKGRTRAPTCNSVRRISPPVLTKLSPGFQNQLIWS